MDKQKMEERLQALLSDINENHADQILGMIKPRFVDCDPEQQTLTLAFPAMRWEANPLGVMQGGVIATILDFSIACLAVCYAGDMPVTVSLQVSYLRGAPIDGTLMVKVRGTKVGRTVVHAFAECWEAQTPDKPVATANSAYLAK